MFMACLFTILHMPSSNSSVVNVKLKVNYSNLPFVSIQHIWDIGWAISWTRQLCKQSYSETQYTVKITCIHLISCVGVSKQNRRLWLHTLLHDYTTTGFNCSGYGLLSTGICIREDTGSAVSGGWKNYHIAAEYMHITYMSLNNLIKNEPPLRCR
jgi:hypothetical protein